MTDKCAVTVLVFSASLREGSLNDRLATLAARRVEAHGGAVVRASMADFDCPSYDGDSVEAATHYPMMKTRWVEFLGERPDAATDRVEETDVRAA